MRCGNKQTKGQGGEYTALALFRFVAVESVRPAFSLTKNEKLTEIMLFVDDANKVRPAGIRPPAGRVPPSVSTPLVACSIISRRQEI